MGRDRPVKEMNRLIEVTDDELEAIDKAMVELDSLCDYGNEDFEFRMKPVILCLRKLYWKGIKKTRKYNKEELV